MGFFNDIYTNVFKPKAKPTPWEVNPTEQARLNNERNSGVYDIPLSNNQPQVLRPEPIQQFNYAKTGSLGTAPTTNTQPPVDKSSSGSGQVLGDTSFNTVGPDPNELLRQQAADEQRLADSVYGEGISYLDKAKSNLEQMLPNVLDQARVQYEQAKNLLTGKRDSAESQFQENEVQSSEMKQDAEARSRRLYDELQRGYNQRFGGSTSAGQAASEIASVEQQRQFGDIRKQYQQTVRQIENARIQNEKEFQNGQIYLQQQRQIRENEIQSEFRQQLLEIDRSKATLGQARAERKLDALRNYRSSMFELQAQQRQFEQQLYLMKYQNDLAIKSYASEQADLLDIARSAPGTFQTNRGTQSSLTLPGDEMSTGNQTSDYTGIIDDDEDEQLTGIMSPNYTDELFRSALV